MLTDYQMTRLMFGIIASSLAANVAVKQIAILHEHLFPLAASVVHILFYVDDGPTRTNSVSKTMKLQRELQEVFIQGGFLFRKRRSNSSAA